MLRSRFILGVAVAVVSSLVPASAYYHFTRYTSRTAPFTSIVEKYDLNTLPGKTLTFLVPDNGAATISQPASFPSVLNLIREAARVWNSVETSDLRVSFGGLYSAGTQQATPGGEILFDELDPLILGLTSRTVRTGGPGPFVPVVRSTIRLNRNLSVWSGASSTSFAQGFFLTVTHEMGHAFGLQHTFSGSVMSTEDFGRATSMARPLDADDIAGVSLLYPNGRLAQTTGSIAGRVALQGQGVHMASVVAIRPGGGAVSALTDPDGRYRIEGLPVDAAGSGPGYYVYAHALPPDGNVTLPLDANGQAVSATGLFDTVLYQRGQPLGTKDPSQASTVIVTPGTVTDGVDFAISRRESSAFSLVKTYRYFDATPVRPAFLSGGATQTVVATGAGLASNNVVAAGLTVAMLGGSVVPPSSVTAYSGSALAIYLQPASFGVGPRHLVFSVSGEILIVPFGMNVVATPPPSIIAATPGIDGANGRVVVIAGINLRQDTRFFFDGVAGSLVRVDEQGRYLVTPPPGVAGLRAQLTAFNSDGQNSTFVQAAAPPTYVYDAGESAGGVSASPITLPAGTESMVEINGVGTNFVEGLATVGFGSSDIQVRRIWVTAPNRMLANVWVAPEATPAATLFSVLNGFQVIAQPFGFQVQPASARSLTISSALISAGTGNGIVPGSTVTVLGSNLAGATVTIGGQPAVLLAASANGITFRVPPNLPTGPAVLRVVSGSESVSVVVQIEPPPPEIRSITAAGNIVLDATRPARPTDMLLMTVAGLGDGGTLALMSQVGIKVGGVEHPAVFVAAGLPGMHLVQFIVSPQAPAGALVPVTVSIEGRTSAPAFIPVRLN